MNCWRWSRRLIANEASLSDLIDYAMFVIIIIITLSLADKYMRCALAISACSWCIAVFSLVCVNCPRLRQNNIRFSLPLGFFQFDIEFPCCLQLTANNCCCYKKKKKNRLAKEIASSHLILPLKVVQYAWACCWCCCCYCSCSCCRCCFLPRQHLMATTFYFAKLFA